MRIVQTKLALVLALLSAAASAQPDQPNRLPSEKLGEAPTVQERIIEERVIAEKAAAEAAVQDEFDEAAAEQAAEDVTANDGSPPPRSGHATIPAPPELVALAAREPEQFIGRTLVLDDGVNAVEVGPVLALRKRILDQEAYLVVDATSYFKSPTQYAIAVKDLDRIEDGLLVMPEADGMHLRGLEYYAQDYAELETTSPETILAEQAEGEAVIEAAEDAADPGAIPLKRF
jgi:hypothetical protein